MSMKWLLCLVFSLYYQFCSAEQFNIYVKYDDAELKSNIQKFNAFLDARGIFKKYDIEPFLVHYPLHTTLYLTHFESYSIPNVINKIKNVTSQWHQFDITATDIYITDGNYVMLDVDDRLGDSGLNPTLQRYSDRMVFALHQIRDTSAPIPDWAKNYPPKQRAFQRYGSPNVLFEFSPHFTLMAKQFKDKQTAQAFHEEMTCLIEQYKKLNPHPPITLKSTSIGFGYVNQYGQITNEIINFELQN